MAGIRQTKDKDGMPHPKWRYWYKDWQGERVWMTGTSDPVRTQAIAESLEARDETLRKQIELGIAQPPTCAEISKPKPITEVIDEYLEWGRAQGGRGGRAWGAGHAHMRNTHLKFWRESLALKTLADLSSGLLPRVEKILRDLHAGGDAGKTVQNKSEAIRALCRWARGREYLTADPLERLKGFDTTVIEKRGTLPSEQIPAVLTGACEYNRLLYEVALSTGLRVGELTALEVQHLNIKRGGLNLEARWTKNRKPGFQPLPKELLLKLQEWVKAGKAAALYASNNRMRARKMPTSPLLFVSAHPAKTIKADMARANVEALEGKMDFHALRHTFVTLLHKCGASFAEAQILARHAAKGLTDGVYTHVREDRLFELVEKVWQVIRGECAIGVQQKMDKDSEKTQLVSIADFNAFQIWRARRDSNPQDAEAKEVAETIASEPEPHHLSPRGNSGIEQLPHNRIAFPSVQDQSQSEPRAINVQRESLIASVLAALDGLPHGIKAEILDAARTRLGDI